VQDREVVGRAVAQFTISPRISREGYVFNWGVKEDGTCVRCETEGGDEAGKAKEGRKQSGETK
jgi:hypothetical protein